MKAVQAIHKKHWPGEEYKNFAPLFRRKARSWNVNKSLTGRCRKLSLFLATTNLLGSCSLLLIGAAAEKNEKKTSKEVNKTVDPDEEEDKDFIVHKDDKDVVEDFEDSNFVSS